VTCRIGFFDDLKDKQARDDYQITVFYGTSGVLHRMDTDGSNHKTLISSLDHPPIALAINRRTGILYWADQTSPYKVYQASTNGTNLTEVLNVDVLHISGIDVDEATGYIYMAEYDGHRILKVPAGTTNGDADDYEFLTSLVVTTPWDVAVDSAGGYLYFVEDTPNDQLSRVPLSGGSKENLVVTNTSGPFSIELDVENNNIYWTDYGLGVGQDAGDLMYRTSLTNPDPNASNSDLPISNMEDPWSLSLFPDAGYLFWISGTYTAGTLCRGETDKLSGVISGFEFSTITGVSSVVVDYWTGN
jgi:hypothetical protein